jgi:seryl-tRNA synthetase
MLDIRLIREDPDLVKGNLKKKFQEDKISLVDEILKKDETWRKSKFKADDLRKERNIVSKKINESKKSKDEKAAREFIKKAKEIPEKINKIEIKNKKLAQEIDEMMLQIPNIISEETPIGKDESNNKEISKKGKIKKFSFPVKNHVELIESLGIGDFESSGNAAGKGFYYLKNELGLLNQALIRFALDYMKKKGYEYIETPLMLNGKSIFASMDKDAIAESVYKIEGEDLAMIGTAEQALLAMHTEEVIKEENLPKKYFSYSMCFRKEIGSHGINEKGLWRTHQFNKVEQFVFCKPEDSKKLYEELLKNTKGILEELELPYRVLELCSGDLADWKYRSADIEVYRPTTKSYGEIVSLSNCTDYQARKLNIKVIDKKGNRRVLHTLNNTALATSRILVAILENFQQKDGSVSIPKILWKYTGFKEIKANKKP